MDVPKISVLIPMYNRKHCIKQCIDSVLAQTFQDFEIIVRDDGSTDGSADFVAQHYATEISSGKLKLHRNEKNIGEFPTNSRLLREAEGKYVMILHSDDLYTVYAAAHLYVTAEKFNADVVHSCNLYQCLSNVLELDKTHITCFETNPVSKVTVMPEALFSRFMEWATDGTFIDLQYNFFRREFVLKNNLFNHVDEANSNAFVLRWILNAKVFVKTPVPTYIRCEPPDSISNDISKFSIEKFISDKIGIARNLEKILPELEWFDDNEEIKRFIMLKLLIRSHQWQISRRGIYRNGISPELRDRVEDTFRKYLGDVAPYPALLFNLVFMIPTDKLWEKIIIEDGLRRVMLTLSPQST